MAEVITETILPGTYIEVRAEGLLSVGAIATGNVGVLGTAEKGDASIATLSDFEAGRARFGDPGPWDNANPDDNLSLVRGLRLLFDNGASTVYARRVFDTNSAVAATHTFAGASGTLPLTAKTPGAWGNRLQVRVEPGEGQELISNEHVQPTSGTYTLSAGQVATPAVAGESIGTVIVRDQGLTHRYQLKVAPTTGGVQVDSSTRVLTFPAAISAGAEVRVNYLVPKDALRKVTFRFGNVQEVYVVPSLSYLAQRIGDEREPSGLITAGTATGTDSLPTTTTGFVPFAGGANGSVTQTLFQEALDELIEQNIQLLLVLRPFSAVKAAVLGHVERTENLGRERIAVVGADSDKAAKILENANDVADKRVVLVAPGLQQQDPSNGRMLKLPPYYAAAAVAGKLASLSPHISPTNKTLAGIEALTQDYNYGDLKALVQNRVLALQTKRGIRVVKGISTHDEAFKQISIRRIVDYVKEGTRIGANQYIGKLNNRRVRENLRTTLDSFLSDLVLREFLTGYNLEVTADRAMEIRGEVLVTMDLMPTFSIDVIRVIMNLS